jgi:hypothetical protein
MVGIFRFRSLYRTAWQVSNRAAVLNLAACAAYSESSARKVNHYGQVRSLSVPGKVAIRR